LTRRFATQRASFERVAPYVYSSTLRHATR
jgi:hypothetical protein